MEGKNQGEAKTTSLDDITIPVILEKLRDVSMVAENAEHGMSLLSDDICCIKEGKSDDELRHDPDNYIEDFVMLIEKILGNLQSVQNSGRSIAKKFSTGDPFEQASKVKNG